MTAQIIQFARRQIEEPLPAFISRTTPFVGLSFVSPQTNEYGWPESLWQPARRDKREVDLGTAYAREAIFALMNHPESRTTGGLALAHTLTAIIQEAARKRQRGGKGSRSIRGAEFGFILALGEMVAILAQAASGSPEISEAMKYKSSLIGGEFPTDVA